MWIPDESKVILTRDIIFREETDNQLKCNGEFVMEDLLEHEEPEKQNLIPQEVFIEIKPLDDTTD